MENWFVRLTVILLLVSKGAISQDYTYDFNGNLSSDPNKQIQSVHYNYLNLPDSILYSDGRKIIYMYTASGLKIKEQVIDASSKVIKKADYLNQFLYNSDTLRQIRHEAGRVVPVLAGNITSPWEYQYEQRDQVGNVRTLLTSRQNVDDNKATFETASANTEQNGFLRYEDTRRINSTLFDHTKSGTTNYSERLNGSANEKYGLSKSLSVMPGDVINLEVFGKYADPDASHWVGTALGPLLSGIASGTAGAGVVVDGTGYATNGNTPFAFAGLNGTAGSDGNGPKAYLNWLVFDRNFVFRTGGFKRMSIAGKENGSNVSHERLWTQLTIREAGYVYVYLSNEETAPLDVFFDDFDVALVKGPVVQQTDYDPFGLVFNETDREHAEQNNFLYNGKELRKDFDLNWYDYGARMYDAALGRWHVIDPKAEKYVSWSPYNYVMNNPVKFWDPNGMSPKCDDCIDEEAIHFSGSSGMPDTQGAPMIQQALELLNSFPEGRALLQERMQDKRVNIYLGTRHRKEFFDGEKRAVGYTADYSQQGRSFKAKYLGLKTSGDYAVFDGLKASVSNHQSLLLIVIAAGTDMHGMPIHDSYELAYVIAHELMAHANPDIQHEAAALGGDLTDAEHKIFGAINAVTFNAYYDGKTKTFKVGYDHTNVEPGSMADIVATQLAKIQEERLNSLTQKNNP